MFFRRLERTRSATVILLNLRAEAPVRLMNFQDIEHVGLLLGPHIVIILSSVEGGGLKLFKDFHPRDHPFRLLSYKVLSVNVQTQRPHIISGWRVTRQ